MEEGRGGMRKVEKWQMASVLLCMVGQKQPFIKIRWERSQRQSGDAVGGKRQLGQRRAPEENEQAEGTPNFTWQRKEHHLIRSSVSFSSIHWLCEHLVSSRQPIQPQNSPRQTEELFMSIKNTHTSNHWMEREGRAWGCSIQVSDARDVSKRQKVRGDGRKWKMWGSWKTEWLTRTAVAVVEANLTAQNN